MLTQTLLIWQAGNNVRDDVVSSTIQLISDSGPELQASITADLWRELSRDKLDRQPLVQVATWAIGEYGDLLLYSPEHTGKVFLTDNPDLVEINMIVFNIDNMDKEWWCFTDDAQHFAGDRGGNFGWLSAYSLVPTKLYSDQAVCPSVSLSSVPASRKTQPG